MNLEPRGRATRSAFTQIRTKNHPPSSLVETSPSKEVKAPPPFKTPSSHLGLDLARISGKERQEALGARVDDVDLVQRYGMYHFLPLLELACAEHRRGPNGLEFEKETSHDLV